MEHNNYQYTKAISFNLEKEYGNLEIPESRKVDINEVFKIGDDFLKNFKEFIYLENNEYFDKLVEVKKKWLKVYLHKSLLNFLQYTW